MDKFPAELRMGQIISHELKDEIERRYNSYLELEQQLAAKDVEMEKWKKDEVALLEELDVARSQRDTFQLGFESQQIELADSQLKVEELQSLTNNMRDELEAIEEAIDDPRLDTTHTAVEIIKNFKQQLTTKDALLVKARDLLERIDRADDDRCFMSGQEILDVEATTKAINKELK